MLHPEIDSPTHPRVHPGWGRSGNTQRPRNTLRNCPNTRCGVAQDCTEESPPRPPQDKVRAKEWLVKTVSMRPVGPEEEASHAEAKKLLASL